jgi:hypothetical protein
MASMADTLPELVLVAETDAAAARRTRRLAVQGTLRRLYPSIYTSNVDSPAETIVLRHWRAIVGHLLPDGVISHRSAFDSRPHEGSLSITRGKTRRDLRLPGLTVHIVPGPGPRLGPPVPDSRFGALYLASDPRRFLENLTRGRGWNDRVLPQEDVEAALDRILMVGGARRLNQLRDHAREIAPVLGYGAQFKRLNSLIGALLGTHESKLLTAKQALARVAGRPYDPYRLEIFDALFTALNKEALETIEDPAPSGIAREDFAFFEAYFSNYIEGTTFEVEEAEAIIFGGKIIENRNEDSHDILGTFQAATIAPWTRPSAAKRGRISRLAAKRQRAGHAAASRQEAWGVERENQPGRRHALRRTGTCRRKFTGRIRTDSRPCAPSSAGHHDDVRGCRSAPVQRRQWTHGAPCDELRVERARFKPNYHSNRVPRGLPAAPKGVEPQQNRRTAHQFLNPRAAMVRGLRLLATTTAIARIARSM